MGLIKIYLTLFITSIKARMEYKVSFLFYIFAILTFYAGQIGLLFVLLNRFHEIRVGQWAKWSFCTPSMPLPMDLLT